MTKVKICGITNTEDALAACEAGADALGFIFAPEGRKRNRYITPEAARDIIAELPPFVVTVGVTIDEPEERLRALLDIVDCVQLCGDEDVAFCNGLGRRAIKAFRAGADFAPAMMAPYETGAWLLDAYVPGAHGGTGQTCDWQVAAQAVEGPRPVILAGGLTPGNVAEAVRIVRPYAVDTSGGVEAEPGRKDHDKIRRFIDNARLSLSG